MISPKLLRYFKLFGSYLYEWVRENLRLKDAEKICVKARRSHFLEQGYEYLRGSGRPMPLDIVQDSTCSPLPPSHLQYQVPVSGRFSGGDP